MMITTRIHILLLLLASFLVASVGSWSLGSLSRRQAWKFASEGMMITGTLLLVASEDTTVSDDEEKEAVQQRMLERRQLMQVSRTSNNRQSYLDLSRQRAALYNTTSRAVSCPPGISCL